MKRIALLGGALLAALAGLVACATVVTLPYRNVSAVKAAAPSGCIAVADAGTINQLCVDDDPAGRGARVSLQFESSPASTCVRVSRPDEGGLAYVDPSDHADRTDLEIAPASGSGTAFVVKGLAETFDGGANLRLEGSGLEIQIYSLPCWKVCRGAIGKTTIHLGGKGGAPSAITATNNGETPICPVLGPMSVTIAGDAGASDAAP